MVVHYQLETPNVATEWKEDDTKNEQKEEEKDYIIVDLVKKFPITFRRNLHIAQNMPFYP